VCGDAAHMAREVNEVLAEVIAEERGVDKEKAEGIVKSMRSMGVYQEDVWS
jgi:NADPH-ferrihemoprotein reductase